MVADMHERKAMMARLADAFVALPGGLGTSEEVFEVATWSQLGMHAKPIGFVNTLRYYDPLFAFLAHGVEQGFMHREHIQHLRLDEDPDALLDELLGSVTPPHLFQSRAARAAMVQ
ncbi:TIGR00730 family Rossman fold protein [Clavibacter sepedonicus]|uniref:LOG family protein n=1 Tax=Clavibacter TaxID=1573 RepID=UPI00031C0737|nr:MULTISPECIES: TIGR00730 family Rossman fold protein [Clavibacter]UUK66374.1 TIGR00730 family Rossman fold protein [Clavibacter sepedonicus]